METLATASPPQATRRERTALPHELIHAIININTTSSDITYGPKARQDQLARFCLVNSTWRAYAQPLLFHSPVLSNKDQVEGFVQESKNAHKRTSDRVVQLTLEDEHNEAHGELHDARLVARHIKDDEPVMMVQLVFSESLTVIPLETFTSEYR